MRAFSSLFLIAPTLSFAVRSNGPSRASSAISMSSDDVAVVGCGFLGSSFCRQFLSSSEFGSRSITGITKSTKNHASIRDQISAAVSPEAASRFTLQTNDEIKASASGKFKDVIFCAPPSGSDDYPGAVRDAVENLWAGTEGGGSFVFTSSGGIYGGGDGAVVSESSPTADPESNPRAAKLINAERACLENGGCVLRLAGLYLLDRGAHNYWLEKMADGQIKGGTDTIINLLHYDDAAGACLAAIKLEPSAVKGAVFLISDGNPTTRRGICESALKAERYKNKSMPVFLGGEDDSKGKTYDGAMSNEFLKWKPVYASFDEYMSSQ